MERVSFEAPGPGRLDTVAAGGLGIPRAEVQRAIAEGRLLVDGRERDDRALDVTHPVRLQAGEAGPLAVLFEDDHLMVVSKPAGLITHGTASKRTGTLVNRLLALGVPLSTAGGVDRPGIVHRLDAGTSGAMLVAKDDRAHLALAEMFRRHDIDRRYLALVRGHVEHDRFLIDAPLSRERARILVRAATGKKAATEIEVRERLARSTLVEARPRTGRTHQIRVHLSAVGHPVLGDRTYGGAGQDATRLGLVRPFLHSWRIAFDHPIAGERIEVEDPLPPDLAEVLNRARAEG